MNSMLEQVYQHSKNSFVFRSGANWFVGVTSRKPTELLSRLTPLVESGSLNAQTLEATTQAFLGWFRESYRQAKQQECTYDDNDIIESVGVLMVDETGKAIVEVLGRFQFWFIKKGQAHAVTANQIQVADSTYIVADPKNTEVVKDIQNVLNHSNPDEVTGHLSTISYPFALLKTGRSNKPINWYRYALIGASLLLISWGVWLGWQQWKVTRANQYTILSDTISSKPIDTIATTEPTPSPATKSQLEPDTTQVADTDTAKLPVPADAINQKGEVVPNKSENQVIAKQYYESAETSLSMARAYIEDGKNKKALMKLGPAASNYNLYLSLKPEMKTMIEPKLKEIKRMRSFIEGTGQ